MKKLAFVLLATALPFCAFAQEAKKSVVISSYRIEPKPGHDKALRDALAAHAKQFHKGEQSWRVGEIMSGPDSGKYHIVEGPSSWTNIDKRGDLGAEHMKDYETNILPHVEKSSPENYMVYEDKLSTVAATAWSNKVAIVHFEAKPGKSTFISDVLRSYKQIFEKQGLNAVVWRSMYSGEVQYSLVFRLKKGFADFDDDTPSTRKVAEDLFGPNAYLKLQETMGDSCTRIWSELVEFKPELGSPAQKP